MPKKDLLLGVGRGCDGVPIPTKGVLVLSK